MPPSLPELFHLVTLLFLPLLVAADRGQSATGDGRLQFSYNGFARRNLTVDGVAAVTANGLLMLTNGTIQMKGHAFHPSPVPFGGARSFSTTFVFAIFGQYVDLSSPGMAFFVATSREVLATALPGQFMGLLNATNSSAAPRARIFAVELDTLLNAECRDISSNHVGVDVDSMVSLAAADAGYYDDRTGRLRNLSLISRQAMQVWVDYDGAATEPEVTVTMAPLGVARPRRPLLRAAVDLSAVLTTAAYVGFSSATGILFSRHMVVGWSFALDGPAPALDIASLPALPQNGPRPRSKALVIVLPIASAAVVFAVGVAAYALARRRLRYAELVEDWEAPFAPHRFSYRDLFRATSGFSDGNLLGAGGFGRVYRGVLLLPTSTTSSRSGRVEMEVAVKRVSHETRQGMKEFIAEVASMRRLRHRNLVQLLGYCRRRRGELLLIYDYMPNGSLDKYLHSKATTTATATEPEVLDWEQRFRIIRGVAAGLAYLHGDWEQVVVHRDVKASNVLLDAQMNGRLGDFGLARLYDHGSDAHTTHVVGTMGYLAPELGHTGRATPATDVFAFGAFLLEVTCGRRPIERQQEEEEGPAVLLADWVAQRWRAGAIADAVDARMATAMDWVGLDQASMVLKLGLLCSHPLPDARPTMRQVVEYLDGDLVLPELPTTYLSSAMLERMYTAEFFSEKNVSPLSYVVSSSSMSIGAVSDLSGGR